MRLIYSKLLKRINIELFNFLKKNLDNKTKIFDS